MQKKINYCLAPVLFCIILSVKSVFEKYGFNLQQVQVIALVVWMVLWWSSDIVPNAITALLPLVLLPIFGITTLLDASKFYSNPIIFLFMGGFFIALAMEKYNLHIRISLRLLLITGINTNGIVLGFLIATSFLSMWISNTAAVLMMLPIAVSIIKILEENKPLGANDRDYSNFRTTLLLTLAYSSSLGGIATIIGTPPNVIYAGFLRQYTVFEISFLQWMLVGLPFSIAMLTVLFLLFTKVLFVSKLKNIASSKDVIKTELDKLGKMGRLILCETDRKERK
ncbi:MAG: SLC13 family permease [Solitalea-like symbiont of Acarus siro]